MTTLSRFHLTLAVALAAHAWLAWELRARATHDVASWKAQPLEAEIAIDPVTVEEPVAVAAPPPSSIDAPVERAAARARAESRASTSPTTQVEPAASSETPTPVVSAPNDGSWTFSPTQTKPGGAVVPPGLTRGGEVGVREAMVEDEKKAAARPPSNLFTPHDVALGLVAGGRFIAMARNEVRTSLVPDISRALLEFDTNREGIVLTVRVLEVSSDRVGWDEVAAALRNEASTGRPERVPRGANGVAVVLEVISSLKTSNGTAPTHGVLESAMRAINNPVDVALEGTQSPHREVAARIVDVHAL